MSNKKVLVLEDDDNRIEYFKKNFISYGFNYDIVKTSEDCIEKLNNNNYDIIFLDHDLGGQQMLPSGTAGSGSDVAKWIHEEKEGSIPDALIIIHSLNRPAAINMQMKIKNSLYMPGIWSNNMFSEFFRRD